MEKYKITSAINIDLVDEDDVKKGEEKKYYCDYCEISFLIKIGDSEDKGRIDKIMNYREVHCPICQRNVYDETVYDRYC